MLYLYLDESGDPGFDFVNKKPSGFFTICVLAIKGQENDRALTKAVREVIGRKLRRRSKQNRAELKGSDTTLAIKKFFYEKTRSIGFKLYAVTLNKMKVYEALTRDKERIYNYVARLTLEHVEFKDAAVRVIITVDKSKSRSEILGFNAYIINQIKALIDPVVPLHIFHALSQERPGLQAADMFAWGISRKYEKGDCSWYDVFKTHVKVDRLYLP